MRRNAHHVARARQEKPISRGGYALFGMDWPATSYPHVMNGNVPMAAVFWKSFTSAARSPDGLPNYNLLRHPP